VDPVTAGPAARPLAGKTAVVTGTAHGIGTAIAEALRGDGASVHGVDKEDVDLTDAGAVRDFFAGLGGVDILVNNAGGVVGQVGHPLEHVSEHHWLEVVHANLTTNFLCTRAVIPVMKERRWGRIVNISSAAGLTVSKTGIQAYTSAKAVRGHGQLHRPRLHPVQPDDRAAVGELRRGGPAAADRRHRHPAAGGTGGYRERGAILRLRAIGLGHRANHRD
jgi:short-subunit dehydrogenase